MRSGTMLGARFALRDTVDHDIPGIERHLAEDTRLGRTTVIDLVHSLAPGAVRREAMRAARLRDPRLARIVATGREVIDGQSVTYVAHEHVPGISLAAILDRHRLDPRRAVAVVGGAARALAVALAAGQSHGYLREECITVTARGRVVVAGVGVDGEAAHQAGLVPAATEEADARALAVLLVRSLTGLEMAEATADDLPEGLSSGARGVALAALRGAPPTTLAALVAALSSADSRVLVDLEGALDALPLRPALAQEEAERAAREAEEARRREEAEREAARAMVEPATLVAASAAADDVRATDLTGESAHEAVRHVLDDLEAEAAAEAAALQSASTQIGGPGEPAAAAEAAALQSASTQIGGPGEPAAADGPAPASGMPVDRHEAAFDTLEIMVAEQNAVREPGTWELVLEALHRRWPRSEGIARSLRRAQERANSGGPLDGTRVVMAIAVVALLLAIVVALIWLGAPLGDEVVIEPDPTGVPGAGPTATEAPDPSP